MRKRSIIFVIAVTISFMINNYFTAKRIDSAKPPTEQTTTEIVHKPVDEPNQPYQATENESYYVLENDYQQLVFSSLGGSLIEINLPFKAEGNNKSSILPISLDKKIITNSPYNSRFPLHSAEIVGKDGTRVVRESSTGGYYPLLRRDLIDQDGKTYYKINPSQYALSLHKEGEYIPNYSVTEFTENSIEFQYVGNGKKIIKRFSFPTGLHESPYMIDMRVQTEGNVTGMTLHSGVPEVEIISNLYTPSLKYKTIYGQKNHIEKIKLPKTIANFHSIYPNWISNSNGFFGLIISPLQESQPGFVVKHLSGKDAPTRLSVLNENSNLYPLSKYPGYSIEMPLQNTNSEMNFRIFAGPFSADILQKIDRTLIDPITKESPNYTEAQNFQGWFAFISEPFGKFLFLLMQFFHKLTNSWGLAIIFLTIALRIILYPLNTWSIKAQLRTQKVQPKIAEIQEKYKNDPQRMNMEIFKLYKQEKANPAVGCLPLLIQMPFGIAMFNLLKSHFDLRGASFIPGWINNLSAPDVLFSWSHSLPLIGTELHLLPILFGIVMYMQQRASMKKSQSESTSQQKLMGNVFALIFPLIFYNMPSGLNIYFLSSMGLQFLQQWYMSKRVKVVT